MALWVGAGLRGMWGGAGGLLPQGSIVLPLASASGMGMAWGLGCIRREGTSEVAPEAVRRRLKEIAKAVGGSYCRLQMPLKLALAVRGSVAGHRYGPCLPMHSSLGASPIRAYVALGEGLLGSGPPGLPQGH